MPDKSLPSEASTRKSAANLLLGLGFAYVFAITTFFVAGQFEDGWGALGMGILVVCCLPPAVLFFLIQYLVRRGHAAGWAKLLTVLLSGPLAWFVIMEFNQLRWMVTLANIFTWTLSHRSEVLSLAMAVVLLSLQIRALILLERWTFCRTLMPQTIVTPPELPWSPFDQTPTEQLDADRSPTSKAGEPLRDDHKPLIDFPEHRE